MRACREHSAQLSALERNLYFTTTTSSVSRLVLGLTVTDIRMSMTLRVRTNGQETMDPSTPRSGQPSVNLVALRRPAAAWVVAVTPIIVITRTQSRFRSINWNISTDYSKSIPAMFGGAILVLGTLFIACTSRSKGRGLGRQT
ncbi:hypothetical protein FOZ62_002963, partial [Perkinsus olseni]